MFFHGTGFLLTAWKGLNRLNTKLTSQQDCQWVQPAEKMIFLQTPCHLDSIRQASLMNTCLCTIGIPGTMHFTKIWQDYAITFCQVRSGMIQSLCWPWEDGWYLTQHKICLAVRFQSQFKPARREHALVQHFSPCSQPIVVLALFCLFVLVFLTGSKHTTDFLSCRTIATSPVVVQFRWHRMETVRSRSAENPKAAALHQIPRSLLLLLL